MSVEFVLAQGSKLFEERFNLLTLWQEIAENFYPERADFTVNRALGSEMAEGLASGSPILVRRELGNAIGGMLRPTNKVWARARVDNWDEVTTEAKAWLERAEERQRKAMYHRQTGFARAVKEADHDFATFGQAVIQATYNRTFTGLLYRCHHLRDCAWTEGTDGLVDVVYRKWKTTAIELARMFPKTLHREIQDKVAKSPYEPVEVWHCVLPRDIFESDGKSKHKTKYVSIYLDVANKHMMEEVGLNRQQYIIPRWQTVSGSQYAYSPAVVVGLPDARTLQEMTLTLLDAGQKAVTPPMLGVQGALRSDVNVMAGGLTWVDREYDERLGEVLRPLTIDKSGIPLGLDMAQAVEAKLTEAFYLNTIGLPPTGGPDMTAFEVGQRVQEYIRRALPLFEPMESEYNGPLTEETFELLMGAGVFGPVFGMPKELQGREVKFQFESPLHDALENVKTQRYLEATSLLANAAAADPAVAHIIDVKKATREALLASGTPADWLRSEQEVNDAAAAEAEAAQIQQQLAQMQQGADIAATIGATQAPAGTGGTGVPN